MSDEVDCPSCNRALERGPMFCPHCQYPFDGDPTDEYRAKRYRQERVAREAKEWADTLPPAQPTKLNIVDPVPTSAAGSGYFL